jgi:hypothetical protein
LVAVQAGFVFFFWQNCFAPFFFFYGIIAPCSYYLHPWVYTDYSVRKRKSYTGQVSRKTKQSVFDKLARAVAGKSSKVDDDVLDNLEEVLDHL